jgi:hypothetical protein
MNFNTADFFLLKGELIMSKKSYTFLGVILIITMIFSVGCRSESSNNNKIAYISSNADSAYEKTFKELQLGILFDFDLKLPNADKSWVDIWVEGYRNGKAVEPFPLTQLSYGLSPEQVEEGPMGFGILNPNSSEAQFFLYSKGFKTAHHNIDNSLLPKEGIRSWDYAIGDKAIGLEPGEEMVLAVYRQGDESLRAGYDYQDTDSINKMINEDTTVILLKIKVAEKNE